MTTQRSNQPDQIDRDGAEESSSVDSEQRHLKAFTWASALKLMNHQSKISGSLGYNFPVQSRRGFKVNLSDLLELLAQDQQVLHVENPPGLNTLTSRIANLEKTIQVQQFQMENAVQPALAKFSRWLESVPKSIAFPLAPPSTNEWSRKIAEILKTTNGILHVFEDLRARLSHYTTIQQQIGDLLKQVRARGSRDLRLAVLTMYDAVHSVYSEDLTQEQLVTIRESLERLRGMPVTTEEVRTLDKTLRFVGFETIPSEQSRYAKYG